MTKTETTEFVIPACDPWAGMNPKMSAAQRAALAPADCPPHEWGELAEPEREMLGGLGLHILAVHGAGGVREQLGYLRARLIEALHATATLTQLGGYSHDLTRYYVRDAVVRARWQRLALALQTPPLLGSSIVDEMFSALAAAGDLAATLRARRAALDAQLERLERLRTPQAAGIGGRR